jgi:small-conductance mechanosensitive channel
LANYLAYGAMAIIIAALGFGLVHSINVGGFSSISLVKDLRIYIDLLIIAVFGILFVLLVSSAIESYGNTRSDGKGVYVLSELFRLFGYSIIVLILLYTIGVDVTGLLIGAGFLGIVVGLAAQTTLGNVFASVSLLSTRPFSIGDRITISGSSYGIVGSTYPHDTMLLGFSGKVVGMGIVYTKMIRDDGTPIMIPNAMLNNSLILNHKRADDVIVSFTMNVDLKKNFNLFEKRVRKRIFAIKDLNKIVLDLDIFILDINSASYSIGFGITTRIKNEKPLIKLMKEVALEEIAKL